jgi:hypothetical protein
MKRGGGERRRGDTGAALLLLLCPLQYFVELSGEVMITVSELEGSSLQNGLFEQL